jgi:rod shape-determining protein MreD
VSRAWASAAALLAAFVLQVVIAPHIALLGTVPSFPVLVVITLALVEGPRAGAWSGFFAGLLLDLLGTHPVGAWALVLTVVGYVAGMVQANLFAEGWLLPVTVAVIASVMAELAYLIVLIILGTGMPLWSSIIAVVLPRGVYNTVLALLLYPWLARFLRPDQGVKSFRRFA